MSKPMTTKQAIKYLEEYVAGVPQEDKDAIPVLLAKKALRYFKRPVFGRFKVIRGKHCEGYSVSEGLEGPDIKPISYRRGETVDSKSDLSIQNQPGCKKFEALSVVNQVSASELEDTPHPVKDSDLTQAEASEYATLDKLTIPELEKYAAEEEIDISGLRKKDEIIRTIIKQLSVLV